MYAKAHVGQDPIQPTAPKQTETPTGRGLALLEVELPEQRGGLECESLSRSIGARYQSTATVATDTAIDIVVLGPGSIQLAADAEGGGEGGCGGGWQVGGSMGAYSSRHALGV